MQLMLVAFPLALARAGKSSPARMAIIAITTSNSINVNPLAGFGFEVVGLVFIRRNGRRPALQIGQFLAVVNDRKQSARRQASRLARRNGGPAFGDSHTPGCRPDFLLIDHEASKPIFTPNPAAVPHRYGGWNCGGRGE